MLGCLIFLKQYAHPVGDSTEKHKVTASVVNTEASLVSFNTEASLVSLHDSKY